MLNLNITLIIWRELFEAILVVSIVHACLLRHLAPKAARRVVAGGAGLGLILSLFLGLGVQLAQAYLTGAALDHFQTGVLLLCAGLMAHMCQWMNRHGQALRGELESTVAEHIGRDDGAMTIGTQRSIGLLVALALSREGFEAVVYLFGMGMNASLATVVVSALLGLALAMASGLALARGIQLIKPRLFFRITGGFLLVTASSMVIAAATRLIQAGLLPPLLDPLFDVSAVLDDRSRLGRILSQVAGYQSAPALTTVLACGIFWLLYAVTSSRSQPPVGKRSATKFAAAAILLFAVGGPVARAEGRGSPSLAPASERLKTKWTGYGDMRLSYYDYGSNGTLKGGAPKDARVDLDATRFVTKLEGFYLPHGVEFEAEVEFEHGGTGVEKSLEYEEAGEYETEVSHGGEIYLEEFYLKKYIRADLVAAVGRIKVGVGLLPLYSLPTDYLAVARSESEIHLIPESWNEMGAELKADLGSVTILAQLVNGLDSTGFSSQYWVASGHQQRFEAIAASDPAGVLRGDVTSWPGVTLGASAYYGGTSRNRPQADLVKTCAKSNDTQVAPCGYIDAPVGIVDLHGRYTGSRVRGSFVALYGRLKNAGKVTERNARLPTALQVYRSPVADAALGLFTEWGIDAGSLLGLTGPRRLEPFVRYDWYDTMFKATSGQLRDARFERHVATMGVSYVIDEAIYVKGDLSRRTYRASERRPESTLSLGTGFLF